MPWVVIAIAFIYGITIGSFLNVVIWRLPRGGSVATPTWSYCPNCEHRLGTPDLVPVFSYLALGRRCRYCRCAISVRYPAIELLTGLLFVAVAARFGATWDTIFNCAFAAVLVCVFFIDLEHFVIPDGLNLLGIVIGVAHNALLLFRHAPSQMGVLLGIAMPASVKGLIVYAGLIYGIGWVSFVALTAIAARNRTVPQAAWMYLKENLQDWLWLVLYYLGRVIPPLRRFTAEPEALQSITAEEIESDADAGGMGGGDGKLAAAIGANLGWLHSLLGAGFAVVVGVIYGVAVMLKDRRQFGARTPVPFGPAMVVGAVLSMFWGPDLLHWYVRAFLSFPGSPFAAPH